MLQFYILVTIYLLVKSSHQNCVLEKAVRLYNFDGVKVNEYLWTERELTAFYCFDKCLKDPRCHSFQVKKVARTCRGHATSFASPSKLYSPTETVSDFQMFLMQSAANYIGDVCVINADCHVTNSMCNDGICTCSLGYMFSPSDSACYTDCTEWSDDLTRHDRKSVWGLNNFTYVRTTEAECRRRCVEANNSSFTCRSADFSPVDQGGICSLSSVHFGNVPLSNKGFNSGGWVYYQRNCAA